MICLICKIEQPARKPCLEKKQKYCSRSCQIVGQSELKRGKKPYQMTAQIAEKISQSKKGVSVWGGTRDLSYLHRDKHWFGSESEYNNLHSWVKKHKGKASNQLCGQCGSNKSVGWANVSHSYKWDLNDYSLLCARCHYQHDTERRPIAWGS